MMRVWLSCSGLSESSARLALPYVLKAMKKRWPRSQPDGWWSDGKMWVVFNHQDKTGKQALDEFSQVLWSCVIGDPDSLDIQIGDLRQE